MDVQWFSVVEIVEHPEVSKDTIYNLIYANRMSGHDVGRFRKLDMGDAGEWVRSVSMATEERDDQKVQPNANDRTNR